MHKKPIIDIIIPTFCRAKGLEELLASLEANGYTDSGDIRITISENGGSDVAHAVFVQWRDRLPLNYIKRGAPLGMLLHLSCCYAMGDAQFIWLIGDDDVMLDFPWSKLKAQLVKNPKLILLNHEDQDPKITQFHFGSDEAYHFPLGYSIVKTYPVLFAFISVVILDRAAAHASLRHLNTGNAYFPIEVSIRVGLTGDGLIITNKCMIGSHSQITWKASYREYNCRHLPLLFDGLNTLLGARECRDLIRNAYAMGVPSLTEQMMFDPLLFIYFLLRYRFSIFLGWWRYHGFRGLFSGLRYFIINFLGPDKLKLKN